MLIRWRLAIVVLCFFQFTSLSAQNRAPEDNASLILIVGDSLSAEYGIQRGTGWVARLRDRLLKQHSAYQIQNASISGDTTSGGLSRLPALLNRYQPDIVIIELGSNDALRGLSLKMTEANLSKMVVLAQEAGARPLLLGMQIPPNYGRQYAEEFRQLYVNVAKAHKVELLPFFLEGIATDPAMFQADRMHPNENAQATLEENVWSRLETMLHP
jgi:acyl-CoA thioesterase-1